MRQILPDALDAYLGTLNRWPDAPADALEADGRAAGLPLVHPETARLLHVLAAAMGARRILEIGTAIGYSAAWLAASLPPDGMVISIEREADRAAAARANLERLGLAGRVSIMVGEAERLVWKVAGPFDLIFQDGDKEQYEPLLDRLIALLRPGGLLAADNALWDGEVVPGYVPDPRRSPASIEAISRYNRRVTSDDRLRSMILPVGDGLALSMKR